jgi:hypothetical protein
MQFSWVAFFIALPASAVAGCSRRCSPSAANGNLASDLFGSADAAKDAVRRVINPRNPEKFLSPAQVCTFRNYLCATRISSSLPVLPDLNLAFGSSAAAVNLIIYTRRGLSSDHVSALSISSDRMPRRSRYARRA